MKKPRRKCKHCKEWYYPKFATTEPCPKYECREKQLTALIPKINRANKAKAKEGLKDWRKPLQKKVQEIARRIDYGQLCLAKQTIAKQFHGGHVFSRGSHDNFKFNLHNIFAQTAQSNHYQKEDYLMKEGVKREFGLKYFDFLIHLHQTPIVKYTQEEYKAIYRKACAIERRLSKDLKVLTNTERIEMRNQINVELGIYPIEFCIFDLKTNN